MRTYISVVVPLLDEEQNIGPLDAELRSVLSGMGRPFEIVYVDDGSTDSTFSELERIARVNGLTRVIRLRRNFGQTAALAAGLATAEGEVIVFMDGDRQNDPADIPALVTRIEEGADVVSGWRANRKDKLLSRRLPSVLANRLISVTTGVRLHDYGCTLKAYRREVLEEVQLYGDMHRFIPVLAHRVGAAISEMPVNHRPRVAGRSKYGFSRTFRVLVDLITVKFLSAYSSRPIHIFGLAAALSMCTGAVAAGISIYQKVADGAYIHRNPLFTIAIFMGVLATQFILMGLLAELAIRTYHESQGKPIYVVRTSFASDSIGPGEALG